MLTIHLLQNTYPTNKVNKVFDFTNTLNFKGLFYKEFANNIASLTIRINENDINTYNYLFISELQKYYFIDNFIIDKQKVHLSLHLDVLTTYKDIINNSMVSIVEKENANPFISNRSSVHDLRYNIKKVTNNVVSPFDKNGFLVAIAIKGNK